MGHLNNDFYFAALFPKMTNKYVQESEVELGALDSKKTFFLLKYNSK